MALPNTTRLIMQKVINVLAVLSFVGTAGIVGGGTALYLNKDSIVENIKSQVASAAAEAIAGATSWNDGFCNARTS